MKPIASQQNTTNERERRIDSKTLNFVVAASRMAKALDAFAWDESDFYRATFAALSDSVSNAVALFCTDGLNYCREMEGYIRHRQFQSRIKDGNTCL